MSRYMFLLCEDKYYLKQKQSNNKTVLPGPMNNSFNLEIWVQTLVLILPFYLPVTSLLTIITKVYRNEMTQKTPELKIYFGIPSTTQIMRDSYEFNGLSQSVIQSG